MTAMRARWLALPLAFALSLWSPPTRGEQTGALEAVVNALTFRNIGPFRTAAWITDIAVPEAPVHEHL
jgi:hypothetical protein